MIAVPPESPEARRRRASGAWQLPTTAEVSRIKPSGTLSEELLLYADDLLKRGTGPSRMLRINMESLEFDALRNYRAMGRFVAERMPRGGYLLPDEAQKVDSRERLAAPLLSSELGTLLTGRVVEIPVEAVDDQWPRAVIADRNVSTEGAGMCGPGVAVLRRKNRGAVSGIALHCEPT